MANTCLSLRNLYLISDSSHEDYLNKVRNNVFVQLLALNSLCMHNKHTHGYSTRMLVWCSLLLLVAITEINVHAMHVKFLCRCLQTRGILENTQHELQNTRV